MNPYPNDSSCRVGRTFARITDNRVGGEIVPVFFFELSSRQKPPEDDGQQPNISCDMQGTFEPYILEHFPHKAVEVPDHPTHKCGERNRMSKRQNPDDTKNTPPTFSAQDARQGEIILQKRWQRWVFVAGLVGIVLLALLLALKL
ncbi:hypothetical protein PY650_24245 [Rhizobium calliandrae]|uniref:Uncharacterized protein n=1 Tax=Rhizobium calliandrae TaxID=1312182 RepID=A0ABT7KJF6_9HYPH|nr:hypothetical protein [Rhizobium calliandrae]MDL2408697.1 hypothetical protein [Rhizobium calliandrae]